MQAGIDKVKLRTTVWAIHDLPARQVELVREAIARNALALIVEPADPTDTHMAEALQKARQTESPWSCSTGRWAHRVQARLPRRQPIKPRKESAASSKTAKSGANPTLASAGAKPLVAGHAPFIHRVGTSARRLGDPQCQEREARSQREEP